uniref:Fibronectin type-III domain-containing protein n=1 Tax=Ascaris lumbricoides TaxID=6252 RepID=A0A0M3HHI8_ASCLU
MRQVLYMVMLIARIDRPGAPGQPEAVATTDDTITLQWDRPISDGGSPIQGYVLEKREEGTPEWSKCAFGTISDTRYKVYSPSIASLFAVVSFATVPLKIISHSKIKSSSERLNEKKPRGFSVLLTVLGYFDAFSSLTCSSSLVAYQAFCLALITSVFGH